MRVDASNRNGKVRFSVTHEDLEQCVGLATAAFVLNQHNVPPGVYLPPDLPRRTRLDILNDVKRDAVLFELVEEKQV